MRAIIFPKSGSEDFCLLELPELQCWRNTPEVISTAQRTNNHSNSRRQTNDFERTTSDETPGAIYFGRMIVHARVTQE